MKNPRPTNDDTAQTPSTRDAYGRFAPGNPGGPGNPFARRTARMLMSIREEISDEEIRMTARRMFELAMEGNVSAT